MLPTKSLKASGSHPVGGVSTTAGMPPSARPPNPPNGLRMPAAAAQAGAPPAATSPASLCGPQLPNRARRSRSAEAAGNAGGGAAARPSPAALTRAPPRVRRRGRRTGAHGLEVVLPRGVLQRGVHPGDHHGRVAVAPAKLAVQSGDGRRRLLVRAHGHEPASLRGARGRRRRACGPQAVAACVCACGMRV